MSTFQEVKTREYMMFERMRKFQEEIRMYKLENNLLLKKVKTQMDEIDRYQNEVIKQQEDTAYATAGAGAGCTIS